MRPYGQATPLVMRKLCLRVRTLSLSLDLLGFFEAAFDQALPFTALNNEATHTQYAPGYSFMHALLEAT